MSAVQRREEPAAKFSLAERRASSRLCALAKLGGRFNSVAQALSHPDFLSATKALTLAALVDFEADPRTLAHARAVEATRVAEALSADAKDRNSKLEQLQDAEYVASERINLLAEARLGNLLRAPESVLASYQSLFSELEHAEKRLWAFRFQCTSWSGCRERALGKVARGNDVILENATQIFGEDAAWSTRSVADAVKKLGTEAKSGNGIEWDECHASKPPSFPKADEEGLVLFITRLRLCGRATIYKHTVLDYGKRLLEGTQASLNFVQTKDGAYVRGTGDGMLLWDEKKWDNWYYRHFLGVFSRYSAICATIPPSSLHTSSSLWRDTA